MHELIWNMVAVATLLGVATYAVLERCMRGRWTARTAVEASSSAPYRASSLVAHAAGRAPRLVRAAALTGIVLGSVAVPAVSYAMDTLESDGIRVSLLPGIACAVAVWIAGGLLLGRARIAPDFARITALATTFSHVALLTVAAIHVIAAELQWSDRPAIAYVLVACTFSALALPQAALLRAAAGRYEREVAPLHGREVSPA